VLRIVLSIGGTEIAHFQTWHDKAGNAPPLTDVDPVTGSKVVFHDLNNDPGFGGEEFQTNLIMPEPTIFLNRNFPKCSIIRPTQTQRRGHGRSECAGREQLIPWPVQRILCVSHELCSRCGRGAARGRSLKRLLCFRGSGPHQRSSGSESRDRF
jgi:hypothetical protein